MYVLSAPINMAVNAAAQKLISIPIPPGMIVDGRSYIKTVIGVDKLPPASVADTLTLWQRLGPLSTSSDPVLFASTLSTTNISAGVTNEAGRGSNTTMQKHGSGGSYAANSLSSMATTVRAAATTVGDLSTTTNYLSVYGQMTTGTTEYGQIHSFTVEIMG